MSEFMGGDDILAAAHRLVPDIKASVEETARLRRLPPELVTRLKEAGMFRMLMPKAWGGPEMSPRAQNEVIEILSAADPSVGWCVMIGSDSGFFVGFHDEAAARELYPNLDICIAGAASPLGRAVRVPGGYRVSGRWPFGSASTHADVIIAISPVYDGDQPVIVNGMPETRMFAAKADKWEILDTWYTTGLAGSGSNDYAATDLFIPEEHTIGGGMTAKPVRPEPLYAWWGVFLANMHGVALGLARGAIDEVKALAERKRAPNFTRAFESDLLKDIPRVRASLAKAEIMLGAARAYTYQTMDQLWDELQRTHTASREVRMAVAFSRFHAFRTAREIAQMMFDTAGSTAIYRSSPLDRYLRDAITASQHWSAQERTLEMYGAALFGAPGGNFF